LSLPDDMDDVALKIFYTLESDLVMQDETDYIKIYHDFSLEKLEEFARNVF